MMWSHVRSPGGTSFGTAFLPPDHMRALRSENIKKLSLANWSQTNGHCCVNGAVAAIIPMVIYMKSRLGFAFRAGLLHEELG